MMYLVMGSQLYLEVEEQWPEKLFANEGEAENYVEIKNNEPNNSEYWVVPMEVY